MRLSLIITELSPAWRIIVFMAERTFIEAKAELADLRGRYLKGDQTVEARMKEVAKEAADLYNETAKRLAAGRGIKPRLITPGKLMMTCRIGIMA